MKRKRLFKFIKYFAFDEKCKVYTTEGDSPQFEGFVSDIPYWLAELCLLHDGGIGVEDGVLCFVVQA